MGFDAPIKGCPGWDVAGLTGHMGRVYTFWLKWITERPKGATREAFAELAAARDARLPGFSAWDRAGYPRDSRPDGIIPFARQTGDEMDSALVALPPEETVWTFVPAQQNAAFIVRRIAMETTIHRWDAEEAHDIAQAIDDNLARDGIDEMLMMYREDPAYEETKDRRHGQTVLLRETSGSGRWRLTFNPDGTTTSSDDSPADATIDGTASDLWLFIMGRRFPEEMNIEGDKALAASWGDLAGRF